jgi:uncharacterized protein YhbP (UPF0306 family)
MSNASLHDRITDYLSARNVLSLATTDERGPWAAPVFFAADGFRLYFVSSPHTRHGVAIGNGTRVAGAITEDHHDWTKIQGVQVEGDCCPVEAADQEKALAVFLGKYPFAAAFLEPTGPLYQKAGSKVRFYQLAVVEIWLTDNTRGFGHREHLVVSTASTVDPAHRADHHPRR